MGFMSRYNGGIKLYLKFLTELYDFVILRFIKLIENFHLRKLNM